MPGRCSGAWRRRISPAGTRRRCRTAGPGRRRRWVPCCGRAKAPPPFLSLRRAVDRSFGARGARLGYARDADGGWRIAIEDPGPLPRLAALAGGIGGLEVTGLSRGDGGPWRLEARPRAPERMTATQLRELGVHAAVGTPVGRNGSEDGKEVPHGTRHRDDS